MSIKPRIARERNATRADQEKWSVTDSETGNVYPFPTRKLCRQAVARWNATAGKRRYTFEKSGGRNGGAISGHERALCGAGCGLTRAECNEIKRVGTPTVPACCPGCTHERSTANTPKEKQNATELKPGQKCNCENDCHFLGTGQHRYQQVDAVAKVKTTLATIEACQFCADNCLVHYTRAQKFGD